MSNSCVRGQIQQPILSSTQEHLYWTHKSIFLIGTHIRTQKSTFLIGKHIQDPQVHIPHRNNRQDSQVPIPHIQEHTYRNTSPQSTQGHMCRTHKSTLCLRRDMHRNTQSGPTVLFHIHRTHKSTFHKETLNRPKPMQLSLVHCYIKYIIIYSQWPEQGTFITIASGISYIDKSQH